MVDLGIELIFGAESSQVCALDDQCLFCDQ